MGERVRNQCLCLARLYTISYTIVWSLASQLGGGQCHFQTTTTCHYCFSWSWTVMEGGSSSGRSLSAFHKATLIFYLPYSLWSDIVWQQWWQWTSASFFGMTGVSPWVCAQLDATWVNSPGLNNKQFYSCTPVFCSLGCEVLSHKRQPTSWRSSGILKVTLHLEGHQRSSTGKAYMNTSMVHRQLILMAAVLFHKLPWISASGDKKLRPQLYLHLLYMHNYICMESAPLNTMEYFWGDMHWLVLWVPSTTDAVLLFIKPSSLYEPFKCISAKCIPCQPWPIWLTPAAFWLCTIITRIMQANFLRVLVGCAAWPDIYFSSVMLFMEWLKAKLDMMEVLSFFLHLSLTCAYRKQNLGGVCLISQQKLCVPSFSLPIT